MTLETWIRRRIQKCDFAYSYLSDKGQDLPIDVQLIKIGTLKGTAYTLLELCKFLYEGQQWENEGLIDSTRNLFEASKALEKKAMARVIEPQKMKTNSESTEYGDEVIECLSRMTQFDDDSIKELVDEIMKEREISWTDFINKPFNTKQTADYFMQIWHKE